MEAKVITTTDEFLKLKLDWERLQEQDEDVTYYSTFEYNWLWWDVYKKDENKSLFIVVVEVNGTIAGIAPFIIEKVDRTIVSYKCLKFLGRGDYLGIIIDRSSNTKHANIIKEIFNFVELENKYYDRVTLTHIKHNSKLSAYMLKNNKYNENYKYLIECPILNCKKYKSYDEYKHEFIGTKAKQYINKLSREIGYNFKVVSNDTQEVYEEISKLHIYEQNYLAQSKGRKERASLYNDEFYSEFVKKIFDKNPKVITFKIEDLNNNLIIYDTCYLYKRVLHAWNMAYDPKFETYHIGRVLNSEIAKYIFESNIADIFDFGAGRYPWKFEWTNDFIFNYQLDMWNENTKQGRFFKKIYEIKNRL